MLTNEQIFSVNREDGSVWTGIGDSYNNEEALAGLIQLYFSWKSYNEFIKQFPNSRRANFPELISEGVASNVLHLLRVNNKTIRGADHSSFDAIDPKSGKTYQFKACSTVTENPVGSDAGPSSFGPRSEYDNLVFLHMDCFNDRMHFYLCDDDFDSLMINRHETFAKQCKDGKRPRFNMFSKIKNNEIKYHYMGYFDFNKEEYIQC